MNISPPLFCGLSHSRPISAQDPTKRSTLPASDTLPTCAQVERPTTRDPSPQPLTTTIPNHQPPEPLFPPSSHSTSAPPPPNPTSSHPPLLTQHNFPFQKAAKTSKSLRPTANGSGITSPAIISTTQIFEPRFSTSVVRRVWFHISCLISRFS